jgi:hypothetical protein
MSKAKFTKASWTARQSDEDPSVWEVEAEGGFTVAIALASPGLTADGGEPEAEDNAHLMAAAPELLDLVSLVNGSFGGGNVVTFSDDDVTRFAEVYAKATGEAA